MAEEPYDPNNQGNTCVQTEHPDYYNRYSVEAVEMARRIWGDEALKHAAEIQAFFYRMRMGSKPGNSIMQELEKEAIWLDIYKKVCNGESIQKQK